MNSIFGWVFAIIMNIGRYFLKRDTPDASRPNAPAQRGMTRRDLFRGRRWNSFGNNGFAPLVMRYPKSELPDSESLDGTVLKQNGTELRQFAEPAKPVRTIAGISIDPVASTEFSAWQPPRTVPVFRPPGAIEEQQFLNGCTRCGDCITACPYDAIRLAPSRFGIAAGTPIIDADYQACLMCEDFPCITACQPGVLIGSIPKVMGTALVTQHLCLAHHGTTCTVCSERCPVPGAIEVSDGKPFIHEDRCSGCGVCRYVCPAPENAILLMPAFIRPSRQ